MIPLLLILSVCLVACAAPTWAAAYPKQGWLSHNVYFELLDPSDASVQGMIDGCWHHLSGIDGILFFAVGRRAEDHHRPVNDANYDVSLHVNFPDQDAHACYQIDSRHLTFVEKFASGWKSVRVCDSVIDGQPSE